MQEHNSKSDVIEKRFPEKTYEVITMMDLNDRAKESIRLAIESFPKKKPGMTMDEFFELMKKNVFS